MPVIKTFDIHVYFNGIVSIIRGNAFGYFADPFILHQSDKHILLVAEYYSRLKRKGDIYTLRINKNSRKYQSHSIISDSNHRSYPFVFHHKNQSFLFIESISKKSLEIYDVINDYKCQFVSRLPGFYVDPSIITQRGKLYLCYYTGFANDDGYCLKQEVTFDCKHLRKIGMPKIIGDHRPAGVLHGALVCQAQNADYGSGIEPAKFNSEQASTIEKMKNHGLHCDITHHICNLGQLTVWDQSRNIAIL